MSTEELMKLDIVTLKQYLIRVQNVVNKRVRRLLERGWNTPAVVKLNESGGLISTKNIIDQQVKMQMIAEIKRGTDFLNSSTGSVRGYIKWVKEISKRTGLDYDPVTTPRVMADAVAIFNQIKELDPAFVIAITSPKLREYINDFVEEIPFLETKTYVKKVFGAFWNYQRLY